MKKILFILPTITQTNGVTAFLINYLSHMNLCKFTIEIVYDDLRPSQNHLDSFKKLNIESFVIPYIKDVGFFKYKKYVSNFFKDHHNYDMVYSNVSYKSFIYFNEARKYGIKCLAIHAHATKFSDNFIKRIIGAFMQKRINSSVNYKFACSKLAGKAMFGSDDFTVVNNAIDYSKFSFDTNNRKMIRDELSISEEDIILGFVGRFAPQKNVYFFIDLIKKLPDNYKVLMIGNGAQKEDFVNNVNADNLSNRFVFVEETSTVYKYYSAFDYFLLPSFYEGLPVVGVEAQSNGLPCLFSDTISDECKISKNTVYLSIKDIDSWVDSINKMSRVENDSLDSEYDINVQAQVYQSILEKMLNI